MSKKSKASNLWTERVKILIWIALFFIILSFIAPLFFTSQSKCMGFINENSGVIGDTIGGTMNPFIALAGVIVTGLAFYMQLTANQIQIKNFNKEFKKQKKNFNKQLKIQDKQSILNQFESQFYEMLRLHKENVNELEIEIRHYNFKNEEEYEVDNKIIKGRNVFIYFKNELEIIFAIYNKYINEELGNFNFNIPYGLFFKGMDVEHELINYFGHELNDFTSIYLEPNYTYNNIFLGVDVKARYSLCQGHENELGHYYRHLFHTVKFVALENEFLDYKEKRKYLRILRAQLSNYEQAMLFYNYLAYAPEWEQKNKFFTDYRMIHNLFPDILINNEYFNKRFDELANMKGVKCYKENDPVFEFQK